MAKPVHPIRHLLLGILVLAGSACSKPDMARPNVLLISVDSLRADRLGFYGHQLEFAPDLKVSPNLDQLAKNSFVFDQAFSTTSWTLPAHAALMTGLDDEAHGVITPAFRIDSLHPVLAERFQEAGWRTGGAWSGNFLEPKYGFDRGFEKYQKCLPADEEHQALAESWIQRLHHSQRDMALTQDQLLALRNRVLRNDVSSLRVRDFALDFLKQGKPDQPFFLFLHFFDVHHDYVPQLADPELARSLDPLYAGNFVGMDWLDDPRVRETLHGKKVRKLGERDLRHVMALYDGEISWVDRQIGVILDRLQSLGLADNTIIALVADHGEEFFEHNGLAHASTLYKEVIRIPFLLHIPNSLLENAQPGRRSKVVRIHDMTATLTDYAGLAPLQFGDGRSLRHEIRGNPRESVGAWSRLVKFRPGSDLPFQDSWRDERFTIVRTLLWEPSADGKTLDIRLMHRASDNMPAIQVFDRVKDPEETRSLLPGDPLWEEALARFARDFDRLQKANAGVPHSPVAQRQSVGPDPNVQGFMEALGYADMEWSAAEPPPALGPFPRPVPR